MVIPAGYMDVLEELKSEELDMVLNYASSLIRNRVPHTKAYDEFMRARNRMLAMNMMTDEEIDMAIHEGMDVIKED